MVKAIVGANWGDEGKGKITDMFASDVVIFNRTDDDTDRGHLRRTIKNINRKAQIVYERKDGLLMSVRRNCRLI